MIYYIRDLYTKEILDTAHTVEEAIEKLKRFKNAEVQII